MLFTKIRKILSIGKFSNKQNLFYSLLSSFLEVLSLGSLIPLIMILVDEKGGQLNELAKFIPLEFQSVDLKSYYLNFTLLILVIYIISLIIYVYLRYLIKKNIFNFQAELAHNIFSEYLNRDYQILINEKISKVHNTIAAETKRFSGGILNSLFEIISKIAVLFLICFLLFIYEPVLTGTIILFGFFLMGLLFFIFKKRISQFNDVISEKIAQNFDFLRTGLTSFLDLKIFNLSTDFLKNYKSNCAEINNQNLKVEMISLFPKLLIESVIILTFFTVIVFSEIKIQENLLLISVFVFSFYKIYPYLSQIFNYVVLFRASKSSIDQLLLSLDNFDVEKEVLNKSNLEFKNEIEIKNINFRYDLNSNSGFNIKNFNLKIKKGDIVAFVGPSGSGKTTIINILMGLLKPQSGQILVDKKILDYSTLENWVKKISYASINPFFTNGTIKKNITFKDNVTDDEQKRLDKIYEVVMLNDVFNQLSEKDQTIISDSSLNLSAGQKQRVNIARSLFKQSDIVFFDEPTSSLDFETEEKMLEKIANSKIFKTAVFATHRKEILKYCNKIVDLNKI